MTAAWMWGRSELRARWRSWVVLGLLAGVTFGLAAAGLGRRPPHVGRASELHRGPAERARRRRPGQRPVVRRGEAAAGRRAARGAAPSIRSWSPSRSTVEADERRRRARAEPQADDASCWPAVIIEGRMADPARADEVVVDQNMQRKYGLDIGKTMTLVADTRRRRRSRSCRPGLLPPRRRSELLQTLHVVGITKSVDSEENWMPSAGFYAKYGDRLAGFVNQFVDAAPRRGRPPEAPAPTCSASSATR